MFETQVFESLEINPAKRIFKINGEDFGKHCESYDISVCQREGEIIVTFNRRGAIKFLNKQIIINKYDARTGKIKSHLKTNESDF